MWYEIAKLPVFVWYEAPYRLSEGRVQDENKYSLRTGSLAALSSGKVSRYLKIGFWWRRDEAV